MPRGRLGLFTILVSLIPSSWRGWVTGRPGILRQTGPFPRHPLARRDGGARVMATAPAPGGRVLASLAAGNLSATTRFGIPSGQVVEPDARVEP